MRSMRPPSWFDGGWWVIVSPPMSTKSYAPPLLQTYSFPSGPSCAPFGPPPGSAIVSLLPSLSTRVIRWPWISQTTSDPSGSTTGPSGNSNPFARTRTSAIPLLLAPNPRLDGSGGRPAAVHERGIERHGPCAVASERDEAAVQPLDDRRRGVAERRTGVTHARRQLVRGGDPDELLTRARARDRDVLIGPCACANHGRVADASVELPADASGRRRGRELAGRAERDGADGPVLVEAPALAVSHEPVRILEVETCVGRVADRALADEQHVRCLLQDRARERHRVAHADDPSAGACVLGYAVHHR